MKKITIGLLALSTVLVFAETAQSAGGCFVREETICKWRLDNCVVKYAIYNDEGNRISDYLLDQRSAYLEASEMRKAGRCRLNFN